MRRSQRAPAAEKPDEGGVAGEASREDGAQVKLRFPIAEPPAEGHAVAIAPGVQWLRLALDGPLGFINVWAIAEGDGVAIVDTGVGGVRTAQTWCAAFAGPLAGRRPTRVFVTHMHSDHIGMAGWLTRKFECRLWITRLEFLTCRSLAADTGREAPEAGLQFYRAAGWEADALERYRARFGFYGRAIELLPDSFERLRDGDDILIGDHPWRIVVGCGHSPEHACFYCPDLKLLISGDQVLPGISSNVSVSPVEPAANPLSDWLTSLARIKTLVPDDVLVLPAHKAPFFGLHARIDELIAGHERGLERLRAHLAQPRRVVDVFPALFRRRIDAQTLSPATGESLAHLNFLRARGEVVSTVDEDGVHWHQTA